MQVELKIGEGRMKRKGLFWIGNKNILVLAFPKSWADYFSFTLVDIVKTSPLKTSLIWLV
jgi:hypothetical protein